MSTRTHRPDDHLLHADVTRAVIGAAFAVHNTLGAGFLEAVYANALDVELRACGIAVEREVPFTIRYRDTPVGLYRADRVVEGKVIVETKAGQFVDPAIVAQLRNDLRAARLEVGLVLNFGLRAEFKRLIATPGRAPCLTSEAEPDRPAERSSTGRGAPAA